ncbi:MAG TPA: imidazolonepropionase [Acidobacteriaceae bacterium]|nr:imidazolonepropionase [Acidobacteriaceae bacterium]
MNDFTPKKFAVIHCGQLVTLAGKSRPRRGAGEMRELSVVEDGAMVIADGKIERTGTTDDLRAALAQEKHLPVIDAQGCVVTPGFVDAHTHMVFAGSRAAEFEQRIDGKTYQQIAAAGGGIATTMRATRDATAEELLALAGRYAEWFLRSGTTTVEAKSGYGLSLDAELKILGVIRSLAQQTPLRIVATLLAAHTIPPEFQQDRAGYIALVVREILPQVQRDKLAKFCDVFCDEHAFTIAESRAILSAAKGAGLGLRMHVEQFAADGGAALAAELGAVTADHLECTDAAGIAALVRASVQPVLVPASVFCLGRDRYPNARAMLDAGLAVVLATDFNPGSSPTTSMPFVMSLACQRMKMLPSEALTAATINAAFSLGLGELAGSLEAGKAADFLIHEFHDYRELSYFAAVPNLPQVFVAGKRVQTCPPSTATIADGAV